MAPRRRSADGIADLMEWTAIAGRRNAWGHDELNAHVMNKFSLPKAEVAAAAMVLQRRGALLGDTYPLKVQDVGYIRSAQALSMPYTGLLGMSLPYESAANEASLTSDAARALEDLSALATRALLGDDAQAIRFGWPSDDGRPQEFPDAVRWLADKMGVQVGGGYRPPRRKDGGVDVVAWRPFPDGRSGFPVHLVQATVERNFVYKSRDIDLPLWASWLALDTPPTTVLAVPYAMAVTSDWNEVAAHSILLERMRLTYLIGLAAPDAFMTRTLALVERCKTELDLLSED